MKHDELKQQIPDDLKVWYSVACDGVHFKTDYAAIKTLIERIAELEAKLAQARKEALEEAAKECDENALTDCSDTGEAARECDAASIRALIAKETPTLQRRRKNENEL